MSVATAAIADSAATTLAAPDAAAAVAIIVVSTATTLAAPDAAAPGRDGAAAAVAIIVVSTGVGIMYVLCMLH